MNRQQNKKIYLYGRLSHEDELAGDSNSIINQRKILSKYAEENGFTPYEFIYDDGFSGTDFERPSFVKMIADVEAERVATVIVKDMSRFGRDYLKVGYLTEILFPAKDVRLIAVNDNLDSERGDNDFAPMMNLFNEWFVKNTSKKIRAVWQSKGKSGERLAVIPPYGYRKDEHDPKKLVVDEESAAIVRRIFRLYVDGNNAARIAEALTKEGHLIPSAYKYEHGIVSKPRSCKDPYVWNKNTIHKLLDAPEYTGVTVNFKTFSKSYKDNRPRMNPLEKQMVFEDTHPAIIDRDIWEMVRKMREHKRRMPRYGDPGLFTGLAYCSDCGAKLYFHTHKVKVQKGTARREYLEGSYSCSEYRKDTKSCTCHYIRESVLEDLVLWNLRQVLIFVSRYENRFVRLMMDKSQTEQRKAVAAQKRAVEKHRRRMAELDRLFERLYEDHVAEKISVERYEKLSAKYEAEYDVVKTEIAALESDLAVQEQQAVSVDSFLIAIRKYTEIETLTPAIVHEFIDKIIIHEPENPRKNRCQQVDIIYNGVGAISLPDESNIAG